MSEDDDFELSPRWKQVASDLFGPKYNFGDVVPHEELRIALGLPTPTGKVDVDDYEQWRLALVGQIDGLRSHLLESKNMDIQAVQGRGYEIVKPAEQTALAMKDGMKQLRSVVHKMGRRVSFVNRDALTADQARQNADALSRLSFLRQQVGTARRLKFGEE